MDTINKIFISGTDSRRFLNQRAIVMKRGGGVSGYPVIFSILRIAGGGHGSAPMYL